MTSVQTQPSSKLRSEGGGGYKYSMRLKYSDDHTSRPVPQSRVMLENMLYYGSHAQ